MFNLLRLSCGRVADECRLLSSDPCAGVCKDVAVDEMNVDVNVVAMQIVYVCDTTPSCFEKFQVLARSARTRENLRCPRRGPDTAQTTSREIALLGFPYISLVLKILQ